MLFKEKKLRHQQYKFKNIQYTAKIDQSCKQQKTMTRIKKISIKIDLQITEIIELRKKY